jgi:hypothetical protein
MALYSCICFASDGSFAVAVASDQPDDEAARASCAEMLKDNPRCHTIEIWQAARRVCHRSQVIDGQGLGPVIQTARRTILAMDERRRAGRKS